MRKTGSSVPRPLYNMARRLKVQIVKETVRRRKNGTVEATIPNFFKAAEPEYGRAQFDAIFGE